MRFLASLALLVALLSTRASAQDVVVQGDPPLTGAMVANYTRFIQWILDTPLTVAQEDRIKSHLVMSWEANDKSEIQRTLNLLELRSDIELLKLQEEPRAKEALRREALRNWDRNSSSDMARWGVALYDASHRPLVAGKPPLTKQMQDAYIEMGSFIANELYGPPATKLDADQRVQLADSLGSQYKTMNPEQTANFASLPAAWVQLRRAWPNLGQPEKAALKADWKARLEPKPAATKPPAVKASASLGQASALTQLRAMTWMVNADAFAKINAFGSGPYAYGNGW